MILEVMLFVQNSVEPLLEDFSQPDVAVQGLQAPPEAVAQEAIQVESLAAAEPREKKPAASAKKSTKRPNRRTGSGGGGGKANARGGSSIRSEDLNDDAGDAAAAGPENNFGFPEAFGIAGVDFPMIDPNNIPQTSFSCEDKSVGG